MSLKNPLKFLRRIEVIQGLLITLFFTLCFFMILIWIQLALYRELKSDITDKQRTQLLTFWALYRNSGIDILQDTIKNNTTGNSIIFLRHSSEPV